MADVPVNVEQNVPQNVQQNVPQIVRVVRPVTWEEAPDYMDLASLVTMVSIWKCWRAPAAFGFLGILSSSLCWEQRALGRRDTAEVIPILVDSIS